ncbi:MAG: CmpA/NrtA family ABC transporter substrate-binding protein [Sphingomicrobium sp.]
MTPLTIAFLPLTDCAVLAAAKEKGFAAENGLDLQLVRDVSWATARDRLIYGQVQCAQMLAPLAVAVSLGLGQHPAALAAPFKLSVNGNAVTFSRRLAAMLEMDAGERVRDPAATAQALATVLRTLPAKPVFAVVHRFSSHALALRYWLSSAGIDPDADIVLRVLPPSFMSDALGRGEIDAFTAGEPWNSVSVASGNGEIVALGSRIWESGPEKVLAMRQDWADANAEVVDRLLQALDRAAAWCQDDRNHAELAAILSSNSYVGCPAELIASALSGQIRLVPGEPSVEERNFLLLHRHASNFPWRSQALWIYSQLARWDYLEPSADAEAAASHVFRSDIYRRALAGGATPLPGASLKLEGSLSGEWPVASDTGKLSLGPDRFFDGEVFDPSAVGDYVQRFKAQA